MTTIEEFDAAWSTDEPRKKHSQPMTAEKAFDVVMGHSSEDQLEEANRVLEAADESRSDFNSVVAEIEQLAKSKLGMSPETASLIAKSEALAAQEAHASLEECVEALRKKRDALVKGVRS